jgi:prepilin-type N-terminal cleavage/methylation domain-containing protein
MRRNANGFTLVEVLVATAVMALVISGLASMGVSTIQADSNSHRVSAATALAQAKLEELRALSHSNAAWTAGSHSQTGLDEEGDSGGSYTRRWTVVTNYNGFKKLSRVTVTVSWDNGAHSVSMASLFR